MIRLSFLIVIAILVTFSAGFAAFAADVVSPQGSSKQIPESGPADSSCDSHQPRCTDKFLSVEAPWISLALANSQSIGLSPEQQRKLDTLRSEFQERTAYHLKSIEKAEFDLQQLLSASFIDMDKVRAVLNTIGALNVSARLGRIETLIRGRAVLTSEQQAKLQSRIVKEMEEHHREMMPCNRGSEECLLDSK